MTLFFCFVHARALRGHHAQKEGRNFCIKGRCDFLFFSHQRKEDVPTVEIVGVFSWVYRPAMRAAPVRRFSPFSRRYLPPLLFFLHFSWPADPGCLRKTVIG
nr:hypothetical protein [Pandoravirus massiliensis]